MYFQLFALIALTAFQSVSQLARSLGGHRPVEPICDLGLDLLNRLSTSLNSTASAVACDQLSKVDLDKSRFHGQCEGFTAGILFWLVLDILQLLRLSWTVAPWLLLREVVGFE